MRATSHLSPPVTWCVEGKLDEREEMTHRRKTRESKREREGDSMQEIRPMCAPVINQCVMKILCCCSNDELYYMKMKSNRYILIIIEEWAKHTVTVLVMHLLLIRVLEGFAVATVSIKTTHTHTQTSKHAYTHTQTYSGMNTGQQ